MILKFRNTFTTTLFVIFKVTSEIKMPYLNAFGSNVEKPLSDLKLAPSNLPYCKFCAKIKILKFGTKNTLFMYFWTGV